MSKQLPFSITIKAYDFIPEREVGFVTPGLKQIVKNAETGLEAEYEVKAPKLARITNLATPKAKKGAA